MSPTRRDVLKASAGSMAIALASPASATIAAPKSSPPSGFVPMICDSLLLMIRASSLEDGAISIFQEQAPGWPTRPYKMTREGPADTLSGRIREPFNGQIAAHIDAIIRLADEAEATLALDDREVIS